MSPKKGGACFGPLAVSLRDIVTPAAIERMRPVQEILPITQGVLRVLINRDDDGLDVVVAPILTACEMPDLRKRALPAPTTENFGPERMVMCITQPINGTERLLMSPRPTVHEEMVPP
jgi:hypothetical protein